MSHSYAYYQRRARLARRRLRGHHRWGRAHRLPITLPRSWVPFIILGAVLVMAATAGTRASAKPGKPARQAQAGVHPPAPGIPAGTSTSLDTPAGWARALLKAEGDPQTSCNLNAVTAWETAEGGGFGNQAAYNPLNLNPPASIGWPGQPATGAWAFPDAADGLKYTIQTLNNGLFGGILTALRAGNNAQNVCTQIMASPWAASHYYGTLTAAC